MSEKKVKVPSLATTGAVINYRDSWRVFRVIAEFVEGYQFLSSLTREITVLGSARLTPDNKYYKLAEEIGSLLGKNGFTTITGGGPGIMEAANKGAYEAGGESVGLNIQLPFEQRINPYVKKSIAFHYFFSRKLMLTSPAQAFIFLPGGFGTLDEFFEVVDYMVMGQMETSPIILVGKEFWQPIVDFLKAKVVGLIHAASESFIDSWQIVETAAEAYELVKDTKDRANVCQVVGGNPFCQEGTDWKIFRMMSELVQGFEFLTKIEKNVTLVGSKSILSDSPYYQAAYELGKQLALEKIAIVTGGGAGIAEAANKGSFENQGESIGISLSLDTKEIANKFVTKSSSFFFPFIRKLIVTAPSQAFVFFPGGFGTLHQLFEVLTLQETGKMHLVPTILYNNEFWQPLVDIVHDLFHKYGTITQMDENFIKVADTTDEILDFYQSQS